MYFYLFQVYNLMINTAFIATSFFSAPRDFIIKDVMDSSLKFMPHVVFYAKTTLSSTHNFNPKSTTHFLNAQIFKQAEYSLYLIHNVKMKPHLNVV